MNNTGWIPLILQEAIWYEVHGEVEGTGEWTCKDAENKRWNDRRYVEHNGVTLLMNMWGTDKILQKHIFFFVGSTQCFKGCVSFPSCPLTIIILVSIYALYLCSTSHSIFHNLLLDMLHSTNSVIAKKS